MDVPTLSFEYDMATMALKGKRFPEAEEKFKNLALKTNSSEAWCGFGISKFGLLLEHTTVEEVFYCFEKAKLADNEEHSEVEQVVLQSSYEVVSNLYNLFINVVMATRTANKRKNIAMFSTAIGAFSSIRAINSNRVMGAIASAGFTAISYDGYLKAGATIGELDTLREQIVKSIEDTKAHVRSFIAIEDQEMDKFFELTKNCEASVKEALKTDDQRAAENVAMQKKQVEEQNRMYLQQKEEELNDTSHPYHSIRVDAIRHYQHKKYKLALPLTNLALIYFKEDTELKKMQEQMLQKFARKDLLICIIPYFALTIVIGISTQTADIRKVFVLIGIPLLAVILFRNSERKKKVAFPATTSK